MSTDATNTERQARWRAARNEDRRLAEEYRRLKEAGVSNGNAAAANDTVSNAQADRIKEIEAENARLVEECQRLNGAVSNVDHEEIAALKQQLAEATAVANGWHAQAVYYEAANMGLFDRKTYELIRNCLHPDKVSEGERAKYHKAFVAFDAHKKVLLKPEPAPARASSPINWDLAEMALRRAQWQGEQDRKNKERAQKAAATRKAKKQPKRALG